MPTIKFLKTILPMGIAALLIPCVSGELITYYNFEETEGDILNDNSGSFYGAPAQLFNLDRVNLDVDGIRGSGIQFLGEHTSGDILFPGGYAEAGGLASAFRVGEVTMGDDITFIVWINLPPGAPTLQDRIIDVTNGVGGIGQFVVGWRILINPGGEGSAFKLQLQLNDDGTANNINHAFSELRDLQTESWSMIAFRYNAETGTASMTVLHQQDTDVDADFIAANTSSVESSQRRLTYGEQMIPKIGANTLASGNKFLNGKLDELRLYDELMDDAYIAAIFNEIIGDVEPVPNWAGFPIESDGRTVDTGELLGLIDIHNQPWIWGETYQAWLYINAENNVSSQGAWVYVPDYIGLVGEALWTNEDWIWSYDLSRWFKVPSVAQADSGAWVFFLGE